MTISARAGRTTAAAAAVAFAGLAAFQLALALGAPLGDAAWGGDSARLSAAERAGSAVSVAFYLAAIWVVLSRAGVLRTSRPSALHRYATWFLVVAFALSAVMNLASQSAWETFVLGPVAAALAVLCAVVARAEPAERKAVAGPPRHRHAVS